MQVLCRPSSNSYASLRSLQSTINRSNRDQNERIAMNRVTAGFMGSGNEGEGGEEETTPEFYDCVGVTEYEPLTYEPRRGTTAADRRFNMELTADRHDDRMDRFIDVGDTLDGFNYTEASADGHNYSGSSENGYNCIGSSAEANNYMVTTADGPGYMRDTMEGYTYTGNTTKRHNYKRASAGGHNVAGSTRDGHIYMRNTMDGHTYRRISAVSNDHLEVSADGCNYIGDTTDGLKYTRASPHRHNYTLKRSNDIRESTDCINDMGAKDDGRISAENFSMAMQNIQREMPSGITLEEKHQPSYHYRPIESDSHGDDLSDSVSYDCLGVIEDESDRYERLRLQGNTDDGHIYTEHIRVMRDILAEMPPGMTAEDVLRTCADDQPTANESDDEDPEEDSDYMEGVIPDITGSRTENNEQKNTRNKIHDATEEQNERLHLDGNSSGEHTNMGHIPPVMRDIPVKMSSGVTGEDNDARRFQNNSDDEDPEEGRL